LTEQNNTIRVILNYNIMDNHIILLIARTTHSHIGLSVILFWLVLVLRKLYSGKYMYLGDSDLNINKQ